MNLHSPLDLVARQGAQPDDGVGGGGVMGTEVAVKASPSKLAERPQAVAAAPTRRRDRNAAPATPNPTIIIAHVDGSGTGAI